MSDVRPSKTYVDRFNDLEASFSEISEIAVEMTNAITTTNLISGEIKRRNDILIDDFRRMSQIVGIQGQIISSLLASLESLSPGITAKTYGNVERDQVAALEAEVQELVSEGRITESSLVESELDLVVYKIENEAAAAVKSVRDFESKIAKELIGKKPGESVQVQSSLSDAMVPLSIVKVFSIVNDAKAEGNNNV